MKFAPFTLMFALALVGCQQKTEAPAQTNPDAKPGLTLSMGQLSLPAVMGNPGAAYFTLTNSGAPATLAAVSVSGAEKSEMHETTGGSMAPIAPLTLKAGETVTFARGGKHVMVFGLNASITVGNKAEITLIFADGDKLSAPLEVLAAGQTPKDNGDMH
jgi:periplasmic copper chaperone A